MFKYHIVLLLTLGVVFNTLSQNKSISMKDTISKFYEAFANKDAETMVSLYHDSIRFYDPAFGELKGERAKNMWRMLCESQKGKEFIVTHHNVQANDEEGMAQWEAKYMFSATDRKVHNKITAQFKFKDGKIIEHIDSFDLHAWSKQALGFTGKILGGTNFFKNKLQKKTNGLLDSYEAKK